MTSLDHMLHLSVIQRGRGETGETGEAVSDDEDTYVSSQMLSPHSQRRRCGRR